MLTKEMLTKEEIARLPETLPHDGAGCYKRTTFHASLARKRGRGGIGYQTVYAPADAIGEVKLPLRFGWNTEKPETNGFYFMHLQRRFPNWASVVCYWPVYLRDLKQGKLEEGSDGVD